MHPVITKREGGGGGEGGDLQRSIRTGLLLASEKPPKCLLNGLFQAQ